MKITRIETFMAPPRRMFVRVETGDGVVGWGEPVVEGRAEPVCAAVEVLSEYLIGQVPMRIEGALVRQIEAGFTAVKMNGCGRMSPISQQSIGIPYDQGAELLDYVTDPEPFRFDTGSLVRTERPGLCVEVDEAAVRAADKKGHTWRNPVWRHEDGSFAEW
ncbi:hypothetical protein OHA37_26705 [Streptomyces sp. NBC_00335]|uniref:hypothetical protein n=1 Tax=unclassified Streptomyces TaxID=2593676 RepID=UPI0022561FBA|nr:MULTISPECIES: hypothetical protein [unclassified Streptomyces]MCX5407441.1 hypothetical protein [Streptomyces sp. NBC_00086]